MGRDGTADRAEAGGGSGSRFPLCRAGGDMPEGELVRAGPNFRHESEAAWPVVHGAPTHGTAGHG